MGKDNLKKGKPDQIRVRGIPGRVKDVFSFGPHAWKGAAYSLLAVAAATWFGTMISSDPASIHTWLVTLTTAVLLGLASLLLGSLIVLLLSLFQKIPAILLPLPWPTPPKSKAPLILQLSLPIRQGSRQDCP